jgi:hypothetical protein
MLSKKELCAHRAAFILIFDCIQTITQKKENEENNNSRFEWPAADSFKVIKILIIFRYIYKIFIYITFSFILYIFYFTTSSLY